MQQTHHNVVKQRGSSSKLPAKLSTLLRGFNLVCTQGEHHLPWPRREIFAGKPLTRLERAFRPPKHVFQNIGVWGFLHSLRHLADLADEST